MAEPIKVKIIGRSYISDAGNRYFVEVVDANSGRLIEGVTAVEIPIITGDNEQMLEIKLTIIRPEIDLEGDVPAVKIFEKKVPLEK